MTRYRCFSFNHLRLQPDTPWLFFITPPIYRQLQTKVIHVSKGSRILGFRKGIKDVLSRSRRTLTRSLLLLHLSIGLLLLRLMLLTIHVVGWLLLLSISIRLRRLTKQVGVVIARHGGRGRTPHGLLLRRWRRGHAKEIRLGWSWLLWHEIMIHIQE